MDPIYKYVARLPLLMRLGFTVLAAGALLDVIAHMTPHSHTPGNVLTMLQQGHFAHFITLAGMLIVLAGVLTASRSTSARLVAPEPCSDEGKAVEAL